jgi:hypothetical protein
VEGHEGAGFTFGHTPPDMSIRRISAPDLRNRTESSFEGCNPGLKVLPFVTRHVIVPGAVAGGFAHIFQHHNFSWYDR